MTPNSFLAPHVVCERPAPERFAALTRQGRFEDYLGIESRCPSVARNAWQRLLDMIEEHGFVRFDRPGRRWKLFDDPFTSGDDAVYGLEERLAKPVRVIGASDHECVDATPVLQRRKGTVRIYDRRGLEGRG
jgi:predicted Ser/Thr protein kinase